MDPAAVKVNEVMLRLGGVRAEVDENIARLQNEAESVLRAMWRRKHIDDDASMTVDQLFQKRESAARQLRETLFMADSQMLLVSRGIPVEGAAHSGLPPNHTSTIHEHTYFIDVKSSDAFNAERDSWTEQAAMKVVAPHHAAAAAEDPLLVPDDPAPAAPEEDTPLATVEVEEPVDIETGENSAT